MRVFSCDCAYVYCVYVEKKKSRDVHAVMNEAPVVTDQTVHKVMGAIASHGYANCGCATVTILSRG